MIKKKNLFIVKVMVCLCLIFTSCQTKQTEFKLGADISFTPQSEARGTVYHDAEGTQKDICEIMAENGFDIIRLRIFVDPTAENGYSRDGFCGLDSTVAMAKRIVAAGMEFALDFHYRDTWADPDKQEKPSSWVGLTGKELENRLYEYTKEVLSEMKAEGVAPSVIQIGNEINHGMVWPEGFINDNSTEENWASLMGLYVAGQKAAREVLPDSKLQVHLALGGENTLCREFLDYMIKYGAEFDIIGLSYYERWHETYNDLQNNLYDLAERYKKPVCVCEYGANAENIKIINDIVRSIPNGLGYGTMAWEPSGVLFSREGQMNSDIFAVYRQLDTDYATKDYKPSVGEPFVRTVDLTEKMVGADISWVAQEEARGKKYFDNGEEKDILDILKSKGFNWIRLRLFVDPTAENGYSKEGFCGLESTLEMAKRVKKAGMKLLLDFHYSDTWADPGKQFTPSSWADKHGSALEGEIYNYSNQTIKRFMDEGVTPDMVQIGNEINHGMLWPQGRIDDSYMSFVVLLRCASAGVRAADPDIKIMVHTACGGQNKESVEFFDKIIGRDVKFDIIGQSYYPEYHGTLEELKSNLTDLATRYSKPVVVVEYQEYRKEVNEIVSSLPDNLGLGSFIWEATSPRWGNLFDREGNTNENMALYPEITKLYNK